jgi:copper chaperone CopZ
MALACAFVIATSFELTARAQEPEYVATRSPSAQRLLLAIDGMQCTSCANGIKAMLKRTPGVISAEVSYERREADVEYDPSGTSPEKIIKAITNMGYKGSVKEHRET